MRNLKHFDLETFINDFTKSKQKKQSKKRKLNSTEKFYLEKTTKKFGR